MRRGFFLVSPHESSRIVAGWRSRETLLTDSAPQPDTCTLLHLPDEILLHILGFLSVDPVTLVVPVDLRAWASWARTCVRGYQLARDPGLWRSWTSQFLPPRAFGVSTDMTHHGFRSLYRAMNRHLGTIFAGSQWYDSCGRVMWRVHPSVLHSPAIQAFFDHVGHAPIADACASDGTRWTLLLRNGHICLLTHVGGQFTFTWWPTPMEGTAYGIYMTPAGDILSWGRTGELYYQQYVDDTFGTRVGQTSSPQLILRAQPIMEIRYDDTDTTNPIVVLQHANGTVTNLSMLQLMSLGVGSAFSEDEILRISEEIRRAEAGGPHP
jgi:hypothetical protein